MIADSKYATALLYRTESRLVYYCAQTALLTCLGTLFKPLRMQALTAECL